jgi:thiol-disulfide isomerase/thioredoxin
MSKPVEAGVAVMNGCGHCDAMKKSWGQFKAENEGNFNGIEIITYERDELPAELSEKVQGFPTFWSKNPDGSYEVHGGVDRTIGGYEKMFGGLSGEPVKEGFGGLFGGAKKRKGKKKTAKKKKAAKKKRTAKKKTAKKKRTVKRKKLFGLF